MNKEVLIRKSVQADILPIAHRMREHDVKEVWASHRSSPYNALLTGLRSRGTCYTILGDGIPEGMIGITRQSLFSDRGIAWMLGTDVLVEDKRLFIKLTKELFDDAVQGFNYIENYISLENRLSLRWIQAMGFEFDEEIKMINGVEFKRFFKELN